MRVRLGDSRLNVTLGKRYTPVRTQIPTGMSKAEYNQLVDDVAALNASVQSLTNRTLALEGQLTAINTSLSTAEDNIATAQTNIQNVVKRLEMSVGSAINLLSCGGAGYSDGLSKTHQGITYTVNPDGSITADGTATGTSRFYIDSNLQLEYGKVYWISGCPAGGAASTYRLRCDCVNSTATFVQDTGEGKSCSPSAADRALRRLFIMINSGVTVNNLKFYPMVIEGTEPMSYISPATARDEDARSDISDLRSAISDISTTISVISDIQTEIDSLKNGVITDISNGTMWIGGNDDS